MNRFLFAVVTITIATVVTLGLGELALRLFAPIEHHEWMIWEPHCYIRGRAVPGQEIRTAGGNVVRINEFGFRGPDHAYTKEPGTLRIEVFGGSSAFCYRASSLEKTWPGALEIELEERLGMPVEVINLALPGFTILQSKFNYLFFGRAFDPDAIIVYHTYNDMGYFRRIEKGPVVSCSQPANHPLWQRIARATQIGRRARMVIFEQRGIRMDLATSKLEGTGQGIDRPVDPDALAWERQGWNDIALLAKSDGVLPILSSQAGMIHPANTDDREARQFLLGADPDFRGFTWPVAIEVWREVTQIIEDVAIANDAIFFDGRGAVPPDFDHLQDSVHLTDLGNEVLAEAMAEALVSDPRFLEVVERVRAE